MLLRSQKIIGDKPKNDNMEKTKNEKDNNKHIHNKKITCKGCIENQPNQLAHMDVGGCLEEHNLDLYAKPIIKIKRLEYEY